MEHIHVQALSRGDENLTVVGVFVCSCGINIAGTVDVKAVADYARTLPNVICVVNNLFTCAADTQDLISQKIGENNLNRTCSTPWRPMESISALCRNESRCYGFPERTGC